MATNTKKEDKKEVSDVLPCEEAATKNSYFVYLRLKPIDVQQADDRINLESFSVNDNSITTFVKKNNELIESKFDFLQVFKPLTSQKKIFDVVVEPRLLDYFSGIDSLFFSYGSSSSGKTFTMQGSSSNPGIIPRVLFTIFLSIKDKQETECTLYPFLFCQASMLSEDQAQSILAEKLEILNTLTRPGAKTHDSSISHTSSTDMCEVLNDSHLRSFPCFDVDGAICSVWVSFYEIYNEQIFDLLVSQPTKIQKPLPLSFDREGDSYYPSGLKQYPAFTWEEAYDMYRYGKRNLHIASTLLNRKSSRSHCIFNIKLLIRPAAGPTDTYYSVQNFVLCDLAGTERMLHIDRSANHTQMKEMQNINKSLLTLNKCFLALKSNRNKLQPTHDPISTHYRESKLTMIFKKFFTGKGKLIMIANASQSPELLLQTSQILKMTSIVHTTRILLDDPLRDTNEKSARTVVNFSKKRFSTMYTKENMNIIVSLGKENNERERNQREAELNDKIQILIQEKAELEQKLTSVQQNFDNQLEILSLEKEQLTERLALAEASSCNASLNEGSAKIAELEKKLKQTNQNLTGVWGDLLRLNRTANEKQIEWHVRLTEANSKLRDMTDYIKEKFGIDDCIEPKAVAKKAVYLFHDMREAASEELEESKQYIVSLEKKIASLQETIAKKDDEISVLKGRNFDLEEQRIALAMENCRISDEEEYKDKSDYWKKTTEFDTDDSVLFLPPKSKTTGKKKRKKKMGNTSIEIPSIPKWPSQSNCTNARRNLLGYASDHLGDDFIPIDPAPESQLSPGSVLKKSLRSGKRI